MVAAFELLASDAVAGATASSPSMALQVRPADSASLQSLSFDRTRARTCMQTHLHAQMVCVTVVACVCMNAPLSPDTHSLR